MIFATANTRDLEIAQKNSGYRRDPVSRGSLDLAPRFLTSRPIIDPGPSGEDPDAGSGNLAMSDHRVSGRCAVGPVDVAGPVTPIKMPGMDDRLAVDVVDEGHQAVLEFVFGGDADMAQ